MGKAGGRFGSLDSVIGGGWIMRCMVIAVKRMMDGNRELKDRDNGATRLHRHYIAWEEADMIVNEHILKLYYYPPFNLLHLCLLLCFASAPEAGER